MLNRHVVYFYIFLILLCRKTSDFHSRPRFSIYDTFLRKLYETGLSNTMKTKRWSDDVCLKLKKLLHEAIESLLLQSEPDAVLVF